MKQRTPSRASDFRICGRGPHAMIARFSFFILLATGFFAACALLNAENNIADVKIERDHWLCNIREYTKANITFRSEQSFRNKDNRYSHLIVGAPGRPYKGVPPILVRLTDGTIINLAEISMDSLKKKATSVEDVSGHYCSEISSGNLIGTDERWPNGTWRLYFGFWVFFVQGEDILSFFGTDWGEDWRMSAIGIPKENKLYDFPLSQAQVIHIFGSPDKIRERLEE